jgi:hypothetical protein
VVLRSKYLSSFDGGRAGRPSDNGFSHRADLTRGAPRLWVVVTCMGRLEQLKRTARSLLAHSELGYCLVDYSCPERSSEWFLTEFDPEVRDGRAVVVSVQNKPYFEKSKALNLGANAVLARGAEVIAFLDVDTIALEGFGSWLARRIRPDRFFIAGASQDGRELSSLTGLIVVPAGSYAASGGYDEGMIGWGGEDIDMRFRMHLSQRLPYSRIPIEFIRAIEHSDGLRVKHHILSLTVSNSHNLARTYDHIREWSGRTLPELNARARRLAGWPIGGPSWHAELPARVARRLRGSQQCHMGAQS